MFQRFASALFGDDVVTPEPSCRHRHDKQPEEEAGEEDWILVNFLGESRLRCAQTCLTASRLFGLVLC